MYFENMGQLLQKIGMYIFYYVLNISSFFIIIINE
ncbi:hypothetical protein C8J95_105262 [Elizabethkingia sp. YR214]|nr:hypothetical protein C8J95_105262 [Elizabethkingia sp. YR214]